MTIKSTIIRRAALVAALLATVGVSVAYAHGTADQSNDPSTDWYFWCEGRSGGLGQGFVPSRRLLSSLDLRMYHEIARDAPVAVNVRQGGPTGAVVGSASSSVSATGPTEPLVHFDFAPPLTLEPQGSFVIELATADPAIVHWMGRIDNPYASGTGYGCGGGALPAHDFNFVTFVPGDAAPPETTMQAGPIESSITRETSVDIVFAGTDDLSYTSNLVSTCELDGRPFAPCASPLSLGPLPDGRHTFAVRMSDQAGQVDPSPATVTWTIDTTPPSRPRVMGPRKLERARATYRFSARDAIAPQGRLQFRCSFDKRGLRPCANRVTRRLAGGRHILRVAAVDEAGNVSRTTAVSIVRKQHRKR
jgi:hypothetical protein